MYIYKAKKTTLLGSHSHKVDHKCIGPYQKIGTSLRVAVLPSIELLQEQARVCHLIGKRYPKI